MDNSKPPVEPEVKNIIDKLANFVARNGVEFEKMTKDKQKGNPKFSFLFGGEHYGYYQYRLRTEHQFQNQQQAEDSIVQHSLQNAPWRQQSPKGQQQGPQQPPIPPLMPRFPRFPSQMQQPMGGRMPMPNMPPWQQNQPMGQQRPPMNMRFMPPPSGQNMRPGMRQPSQMYKQPPPGGNEAGSNMQMQQNQQMGPPPQNFNMYRQPPPNMPPQRGQAPPGPPFQYQDSLPRHQRPSQFNQPPDIGMHPPQNEEYPSQNQEEYQQDPAEERQRQEEDEEIRIAEEDAEKRIEESGNNLKQQYEVLMQQQQEQIENAIAQAQDKKLRDMASNTGIMTSEFDSVLQPIIATCTKDSISSGKSWILSNATTTQHCEVIGLHMLKRVLEAEKMTPGETVSGKSRFETQLHIVYLINDVLHHASRKNLKDLSTALQAVILPIFCMANANSTHVEKDRLTKLLGLWRKFKYFQEELLDKLNDPSSALSEYQANLILEHASEVQKVQSEIQSQYKQYEQQHQQYAAHIEKQVKEKKIALEEKRAEERAKQEEEKSQEIDIPPWANENPLEDYVDDGMGYDYNQDPSMNLPPQVIDYSHSRNPTEWQEAEFGPRPPWNQGPRGPRMGEPWQEGPPWDGGPRPRAPGPRGPPVDLNDPSLIPTVPYYDLPAGLMCPLVKLEDTEYKPLDPDLIRLPPPIPPSERLLAAVEAFYGPPSREGPRSVDGWEKNGLFEFYRAKVRVKRHEEGNASRSGSKSKSRSRSRSQSKRRSYSRSDSSRSRSRSRSKSSRSRSRSRSKSPRQGSRSPDRGRRSRSRSNDRGRSPTPPLGGGGGLFLQQTPGDKLGDENRGAQMLKRMGWGGAGLGANEQGRENPIDHSEVRDKYDQFKGLGMPPSDPYESFRKSKSQGFVTRMKARDKGKDRDTPRRNRNEDDHH